MKGLAAGLLFAVSLCLLFTIPAMSQAPEASPAPQAPRQRPPENLPWTRFHPAAPPYQPTTEEKQRIQTKLDELDSKIRELRSQKTNDDLLPDVEIYGEAARWKLTYPEEFFRQRSVDDTIAVLDQGLARAAQLKDGKSPWTTQNGRVVRGFRSALDGTVQPVRITVPDDSTVRDRFHWISRCTGVSRVCMKSRL